MAQKILIVDDDPAFREELRDCLEQRYWVVEAEDGEQALRILNKPHTIDLVVLDVMLPRLKGTAILERIKNRNPDLPVIIFTGYSSKEIAVESLKAHADDYLEKPGNVTMILETIEKIIRKKKAEDADGVTDLDHKTGKVLEFIRRNLDRRITLEEAAKEVFLSPKYLSRLFKQKTGVGLNRYIQKVRVDKAKSLLITGNISVGRIAEQLGYKNTESFIRTFTKHTGCAPGRFGRKTGCRDGAGIKTQAVGYGKRKPSRKAPNNAKKSG